MSPWPMLAGVVPVVCSQAVGVLACMSYGMVAARWPGDVPRCSEGPGLLMRQALTGSAMMPIMAPVCAMKPRIRGCTCMKHRHSQCIAMRLLMEGLWMLEWQ